MEFSKIERSYEKLLTSERFDSSQMSGCTAQQLHEIEEALAVPLPGAYRAFLGLVGVSAGTFHAGASFLFPEILTLRADAEKLLGECGAPFELSPQAIVFMVHEGNQFLFMIPDGTKDPAVHYYVEGDIAAQPLFSSFSDWFSAVVDDELEFLNDHPPTVPGFRNLGS